MKWLTYLTIFALMLPLANAFYQNGNCSNNIFFDNTTNSGDLYKLLLIDNSFDCIAYLNCWYPYNYISLAYNLNWISINDTTESLPNNHSLDNSYSNYEYLASGKVDGTFNITAIFSSIGQPSCEMNLSIKKGTGIYIPPTNVCTPPKKFFDVWNITENQTCEDRIICRGGSTYIQDGYSLTLKNSKVYNLWLSADLHVFGDLFVDTTSFLYPYDFNICTQKPIKDIIVPIIEQAGIPSILLIVLAVTCIIVFLLA